MEPRLTDDVGQLTEPLVQFSTTDRMAIGKDIDWWTSNCIHALSQLRHTKASSGDDLEARAVVCGRIAALGLAMAEHFGSAVNSLGHEGTEAVMAAATSELNRGQRHTKRMEELAKSALN